MEADDDVPAGVLLSVARCLSGMVMVVLPLPLPLLMPLLVVSDGAGVGV